MIAAPHGEFIIADRGDDRVRKVSRAGIITTVAGDGRACQPTTASCGDGGKATHAELARPHGAAITKHGVYIADRDDNRIRFVDVGLP